MRLALAGVLALFGIALLAFSALLEPLAMKVDFGQKVRDWDGFGVNYVETHQTRDYRMLQDEYGGFSLLSPDKQGLKDVGIADSEPSSWVNFNSFGYA